MNQLKGNCRYALAADDAAAEKRKEIAEKLRRGEDVNITSSGEVVEDTDNIASQKILKAPEGKLASDTFVCDTCGCIMHLKVNGNSTYCREEGCNGTMHRV